MLENIKNNFLAIIKYFVAYWGALSTLLGVWIAFFSWEDMGVNRKITRLLILLGIIAIAFITAIITVLCRNKKRIFGDINKGVTLCYDDIIKLGFPKKATGRKIVVIPVNRCFDLSCENNLISKKTIHGQWIGKFIKSAQKEQEIDLYIQNELRKQGVSFDTIAKESKKEGNTCRYPCGTVVSIEGNNNITFYLLALSNFDEGLRAHCSELEFCETIQGLLHYYDRYGQGEDLYCPVMGDHIVRPTKNTNDVIDLMLSIFKFNNSLIHGNINLVVYNKMKKDISILNK